jgi:hypothetical protein
VVRFWANTEPQRTQRSAEKSKSFFNLIFLVMIVIPPPSGVRDWEKLHPWQLVIAARA